MFDPKFTFGVGISAVGNGGACAGVCVFTSDVGRLSSLLVSWKLYSLLIVFASIITSSLRFGRVDCDHY